MSLGQIPLSWAINCELQPYSRPCTESNHVARWLLGEAGEEQARRTALVVLHKSRALIAPQGQSMSAQANGLVVTHLFKDPTGWAAPQGATDSSPGQIGGRSPPTQPWVDEPDAAMAEREGRQQTGG